MAIGCGELPHPDSPPARWRRPPPWHRHSRRRPHAIIGAACLSRQRGDTGLSARPRATASKGSVRRTSLPMAVPSRVRGAARARRRLSRAAPAAAARLAVRTAAGRDPVALPASGADDTVTLNFVNADIDAVVKAVSEITGRNFILDPKIKGTVNIISARPGAEEPRLSDAAVRAAAAGRGRDRGQRRHQAGARDRRQDARLRGRAGPRRGRRRPPASRR